MENIDEIEELLDDSLETLVDKKRYSKEMNKMIKECAKINGLDKSSLKRCKDYSYFKGKGWLNNDPLTKDPSSKEKDKLTPIFSKLREVFEDLNMIGDIDLLKPYLEKLELSGIKITYSPKVAYTTKQSVDEIKDVINSAVNYQNKVSTLDSRLKDEDSVKSEDLGFIPKNGFVKALSIYDKIKEEKDVEDNIQENIANHMMFANAYNFLSKKIKKEDD